MWGGEDGKMVGTGATCDWSAADGADCPKRSQRGSPARHPVCSSRFSTLAVFTCQYLSVSPIAGSRSHCL